MTSYSPLITIMMKAVRKAARGLVRDFGEVENLQVSQKGPADFVSNADIQAEKAIIEELRLARPKFGFLVEEAGEIKGADVSHRWIVDPLDGTTNFLHGLPQFCISIALEHTPAGGKPEIIAGVIDAPVLRETFWAEKGKGAFTETHDGKSARLRVANRKNLDVALLATGSLLKGSQKQQEMSARLSQKTVGVRAMGSAALDLAYTAAGRYDAFVHIGLKPWDMAAAILLIKEAGGIVTDAQSQYNMLNNGTIVAANEVLHTKIIRELAS